MKLTLFIFVLLTLSFSLNSYAEPAPNNSELEQWFNSDDEISTDHISEGELKFLEKPPLKPSLHSINRISISEESLTTGWVLLEQCYENLDPVPVTEIVYQYKSIRGLRITSNKNIATANIDNKTIHLEYVEKNAELCIKAEVKILNKLSDISYNLKNGPFHRKFLHGYYPYHLTLQVNYPSSIIELSSVTPANQIGFKVKREFNMLHIESHFEGMLNIQLLFKKTIANT